MTNNIFAAGIRLASVVSSSRAFTTARAVVAKSATLTQLAGTDLARQGRALARRAGALFQDEEANAPVIQVVRMATATAGDTVDDSRQIIGSFRDFILSGVQEQDAEKLEVVETFGHPHVFASGRFMRKYTFSGFCRSSPVNYQDTVRATHHVTQSALLRVFYDQYMRASVQANLSRFTRIIVDGDIYEGWVTTLNIGRESSTEHFVQFTMSMVAFNRRNARVDPGALQLLSVFRSTGKGVAKVNPKLAIAELDLVKGKTELALSVDGGASFASSVALAINDDISGSNLQPQGFTRPNLLLQVTNVAQPVEVVTTTADGHPVRGLHVTGATGEQLSHSTPALGTTPLGFKVHSLAQLRATLGIPVDDTERHIAVLVSTIKPRIGRPVQLRVQISIRGGNEVTFAAAKLIGTNQAVTTPTPGFTIGLTAGELAKASPLGVFLAGSNQMQLFWSFVLRDTGGTPLDADSLLKAQLVVTPPNGKSLEAAGSPALTDGRLATYLADVSLAKRANSVRMVTTLETTPGGSPPGTVVFKTLVTFTYGTVLGDVTFGARTNPFMLASALRVDLAAALTIPGFTVPATLKPASFVVALSPPALADALVRAHVPSVDAAGNVTFNFAIREGSPLLTLDPVAAVAAADTLARMMTITLGTGLSFSTLKGTKLVFPVSLRSNYDLVPVEYLIHRATLDRQLFALHALPLDDRLLSVVPRLRRLLQTTRITATFSEPGFVSPAPFPFGT